MSIFSVCKVCTPPRRRLLVRKWTFDFTVHAPSGEVIRKETLTTQSKMCYNCMRTIRKMLNN